MKTISFVIPCYASEGSVALVMEEIRQTVAEKPEFDYEIVAVNDCSPDNVLSVLRQEAEADPQGEGGRPGQERWAALRADGWVPRGVGRLCGVYR